MKMKSKMSVCRKRIGHGRRESKIEEWIFRGSFQQFYIKFKLSVNIQNVIKYRNMDILLLLNI